MQVTVTPFTVHKRVPLTISRGTTAHSTNLWVRVRQDSHEGWGEATPFSIGTQTQTTEQLQAALTAIAPKLSPYHPLDRQALEPHLNTLPSAARAAIDIALHDWLGKQAGLPLWQILGLNRHAIGPTAVTIGINTPERACQRLQDWQAQIPDLKSVKVKLGNPAGIEADRAMMSALRAHIPLGAKVSVDANGGWDLESAIAMAQWLSDRGIAYIEQPLSPQQDGSLQQLSTTSPLPIFVDESCFTSHDIPRLAGSVHGINIKLMKAGGLTEALRMIHTAQAHGLAVMFGCYSDSSLANTALAQLAPLATHLDLDSHLNLRDDPFDGATLTQGCLLPNDLPGLGLTHHDVPATH